MKRLIGFGLSCAVALAIAAPVFAETIELVTYYPAPGSGSNDHVDSLTVGDAYDGVTAPNGMVFIEDRLGIGAGFTAANPPLGSLHVVGPAGEDDRVLFMPGAGGTMRVGIGTANPLDAALEVSGLPNAAGNVVAAIREATNTAASAPSLVLRRARGTDDVPAIVQNGDVLGKLEFEGYDGFNRITGAQIRAEMDGVPGANDLPTRLVFTTTPDGAAVPVERMRITNAGNIGIGTNAPTAQLDLTGQIRMRGGAPNANGRNANAAATQPVFTDANGVASRGWPAGSVVQMVFLSAGSATTVPVHATAQPLGNAITITPRSANSTLIVEANFDGYVEDNDDNGGNSSAYFRMRETTGGGAVLLGAGDLQLSASSDNSSPNGIAAYAPCLVRAIVVNGVVTARTFRLYGWASTGVYTVKGAANFIVLTVTEIQN